MSSVNTVSQVMKNLLVVNIDTTLNELMKQINWNHYRCIAVVDDEENLFGVITRQLIGYATKRKLNFNTVRAWEICTPDIIIIPPDTPLKDAIDKMIENRIRHLIIMNDNNLSGVVTPIDILSMINWDNPNILTDKTSDLEN